MNASRLWGTVPGEQFVERPARAGADRRGLRARRRRGGDGRRARSSRRCRCRTPGAESARAPPAAATAAASAARSRRFAPTPPATTSASMPVWRSARSDLATSVSTIASSKPRATSARAASSSTRPRTATTTAVLSPLKLKSSPGRSSIGRGSSTAPVAAALGERRERRPAGIAEAEQFCGLVEGFARRVVQRLAEDAVAADARHLHEHRVPAGHLQRHKGEIRRSGSSAGASRWPSRWCTPTTGTPQA